MSFKFIQHLLLIGFSIAIGFLYIQPEFLALRDKQSEVQQYQQAVASAADFNAHLSQLLQKIDSLSIADLDALEAFLPQEVDTVAVARDIERLARQSGLIVGSIGVADQSDKEPVQAVQREVLTGDVSEAELAAAADAQSLREGLQPQTFTVSVAGRYEDFVQFLAATERNQYPLQVTQLSVASAEESAEEEAASISDPVLSYTLTLQVYAAQVVIE